MAAKKLKLPHANDCEFFWKSWEGHPFGQAVRRKTQSFVPLRMPPILSDGIAYFSIRTPHSAFMTYAFAASAFFHVRLGAFTTRPFLIALAVTRI